MKKVILMLLVILLGAQLAGAQIVRSQSRSITVTEEKKEKVKKERINYGHDWVVKLGGGVNIVGDHEMPRTYSYNFSFGYHHILNTQGLYLGGQVGVTSADRMVFDYHPIVIHHISHNIGLYVGPVFGIKIRLADNIKFDQHIGVSYFHRFQNDYWDDEKIHWNLGLGLWFNRFLVEVDYAGSGPGDLNTAFLLNLGFRF